MKQILIVGGTGTLGKELTKQLLAHGNCVYVLSHNPKKSAHLSEAGIVVIPGDLTDKASLVSACRGKDVVISSAHSLFGWGKYASEKIDGRGQKDLIDAAAEAGVKYFIFTSGMGASPDHEVGFWRRKWEAEQHLKRSGMAYNIVRASAFMETHIHELMGKSILQKGKATIFGKGENPTNFISVKDVAQLMVTCLENPQWHNQTFEIGGPDNVSRLEIVKMYEAKIGKPVRVSHLSNGMLRIISKLMKPFHPGLSEVMFSADLFDRTDQAFDVQPLLKKIPIQFTRVADFIRSS